MVRFWVLELDFNSNFQKSFLYMQNGERGISYSNKVSD